MKNNIDNPTRGKRKGVKDKCHIENLDIDKLQKLIDSKRDYRYSEFCPMIGLQRLQGDSKIKQLAELGAICEYEKNKTRFKFIRLRTEDEIILYNERSKYTPLMECMLMELLLEKIDKGECEKGIFYMTTPQVLRTMRMVNDNFILLHSSPIKWAYKTAAIQSHTGFNMRDINIFMSITYRNILKPIVRDSFKSIDNKRGIMIQRGYKVFNVVNGVRVYNNILATSKLGQELTAITGKALEEAGIESIDKLFYKPMRQIKDFYAICDALCQQRLGYDGFYDCYALSISEERLKRVYHWNLESVQREMNKRVIDRVDNAKQLDKLTTISKKTLIGAVIDIESQYDFQYDYENMLLNKGV